MSAQKYLSAIALRLLYLGLEYGLKKLEQHIADNKKSSEV